jgi:hypothetical protein
MRKVITYQAPNGETIDLTQKEVEQLKKDGEWPKNSIGQEYCTVSHGLHSVREYNEFDDE